MSVKNQDKIINNLEKAKINWQEKLVYLEQELPLISSPSQKFELIERIKECENQIQRLTKEIESLKRVQTTTNVSISGNSPLNQPQVTSDLNTVMKDIFICHASEDKQKVIEPIVTAFKQVNISYWYDKAEIKWGDSITKKVNEGLSISRFVMVVLSSAFLDKNWPQRELYSVLNIEAALGDAKILPLVVGANKQERQVIFEKLPLLNDKAYLVWKGDAQDITTALSKIL